MKTAAKVRILSKICKPFAISRFFYRNFTHYLEKNRILLLLLHYYLKKAEIRVLSLIKLLPPTWRFIAFSTKKYFFCLSITKFGATFARSNCVISVLLKYTSKILKHILTQ